jgi:hypothetical protein
MNHLRKAKIVAIICVFSVFFMIGVSTAQNGDRVTTPDSEVSISPTGFFMVSWIILLAALFVIVLLRGIPSIGW